MGFGLRTGLCPKPVMGLLFYSEQQQQNEEEEDKEKEKRKKERKGARGPTATGVAVLGSG